MEGKPKSVDHQRARVNIAFEVILYEGDTNAALTRELQSGIEDLLGGDVHDLKVTVENL